VWSRFRTQKKSLKEVVSPEDPARGYVQNLESGQLAALKSWRQTCAQAVLVDSLIFFISGGAYVTKEKAKNNLYCSTGIRMRDLLLELHEKKYHIWTLAFFL
jgi:hypothetical protein